MLKSLAKGGVLLVSVLGLGLSTAGASLAATVPAGFEDRTLVSGLDFPTAVSWAPDGRMFVAEKAGRVRVVTAAGALVDQPLLDISGHVNTIVDQGILGMAVDSAFATNRYLYILYAHEANPADPYGPKTARLSRVVVRPDNTVENPASPETVIVGQVSTPPCPAPSNTVDCIPSAWTHTIGTVRSGSDGTLWIGVGDGGGNFRAYDENSYSGKILHVDRAGRGLPGHPFCPADNDLTHVCTKIYAKGLRNPFRFTLRPQGGLVVSDVGDETRDEVDFVTAGKNYGWPCYEGTIRSPRYSADTRCSGAGGEYSKEGTAAASVGPVHDYSIPPEGAAGVGGPTYTATSFPAAYQGDVFFGDYVKGWVKRLDIAADGTVSSVQDFATDWSGVDLQVAPWGDLVYVDILGGAVRAISYSPDNRTPIVQAGATPTSGPLPLTVQFSSAGTSDPDGDPLIYEWDFGDGATSSQANPSHPYTTDGKFTAVLRVSDNHGRSATDTVVISAGNAPPTATITAPAAGAKFRDGQTIALQGSATDVLDGTLTGSSLRWDIRLHHGTHIHPFGPFTGASTSFQATDDHDADSFYEVRLTATNSRGLSDTATVNVNPETIDLTLDSIPTKAPLTYSGTSAKAPIVRDATIGFRTSISAAERFFGENGATYKWVMWTDNGARLHDITVPATNKRIVAVFGDDKAAGRAASASSSAGAGSQPGAAVDGAPGTSWSSAVATGQWWQVDLGANRSLNQIWITWNNTFASQYQVSTSTNGVNFTTAADVSITQPGLKATSFASRTARYVRVTGIKRATFGGISFSDVNLFGAGDSFVPEDKARGKAATADYSALAYPPSNAVDGNSATRWESAPGTNHWWQVDLGCSRPVDRVALNWQAQFATQHRISTSTDGVNFTTASDVTIGGSGWNVTNFSSRAARYVRVTTIKRSSFGGVSFWDARVFGPADSGCSAPAVANTPSSPPTQPAASPTAPPPSPDPPSGTSSDVTPLRVSERAVVVGRKGTAAIRVRCLASKRCRGTLAVVRGSKKNRISLGRASFSIPSHRSQVVQVKLTRDGKKRLKRARRLSCKTSVSIRISGRRLVVSAPLILRAR